MIGALRLIHLAAAAFFLGNITATLAWKLCAERSRDRRLVVFALDTAILTDRVITAPSAALITLSGILLLVAGDGANLLPRAWLQISIVIWIVSAVAALAYLIPSLNRLRELAEKQSATGSLEHDYYIAAARWNVASAVLIISPLIVFALAVIQPEW